MSEIFSLGFLCVLVGTSEIIPEFSGYLKPSDNFLLLFTWSVTSGYWGCPEIAIICLLNDNIGVLSFCIKYCEVFGRNCRTKELRLLKKCHILLLVCPRKTICCTAANNLHYQICPVPVRSWVPFISFWSQKGFNMLQLRLCWILMSW